MEEIAGIGLTALGVLLAYLQLRQGRKKKEKPNKEKTKLQATQSENLERKYRNHIKETYQYLGFKGILQLERFSIRILLNDVYVDLSLLPLASKDYRSIQGVKLAGRDLNSSQVSDLLKEKIDPEKYYEKRLPVEEALRNNSGIVLLGDPGAGKSTIIKYLALKLASPEPLIIANIDIDYLPIILPIAAYATALEKDEEISIISFLSIYCVKIRNMNFDVSSLIETKLESGKALVLLDGLDEVSSVNTRGIIVNRVRDFFNWYKGNGNKFIITSRVVGYRESPIIADELSHYVVLDFNRKEIEIFVSKWINAFEEQANGINQANVKIINTQKEKLISDIYSNDRVENLASNPLLITVLALIHRQGIELPRRRVELYEIYLKTLINSWARARNLDGKPIGPMDEVEAVKLLAPIAYWMHLEKRMGTAEEEELNKMIKEYYATKKELSIEKAEAEAVKFLDGIKKYSGILTERGIKEIGFIHLTFEEYLAGREIIFQGQLDKHKSLEIIKRHLFDPLWNEVIQLAVGYTGIIAKEENAAALMINGIVDVETNQVNLGKNIIIAANCLRDIGKEGVGIKCWNNVKNHITKLVGSEEASEPTRWQAGELLNFLGDTRLESDESLVPHMIDVKGGKFIMGTEETAIAEYVEEIKKVDPPIGQEWVTDYWIKTLLSESPQHDNEVESFRVSKFQITNSQYKLFIDDNPDVEVPYDTTELAQIFNWSKDTRSFPRKLGNHPVVLINWLQAHKYCNWLTKKTGRKFRLPTEAEWEYAARGSKGIIYPWGDDWMLNHANTLENGGKSTVSVGCYPKGKSVHGLWDITGQVWEWTSTAWGKSWQDESFKYPYVFDQREVFDLQNERIVRGGAWDDVSIFARCASRGPNKVDFKSHYIGFRIVESS